MEMTKKEEKKSEGNFNIEKVITDLQELSEQIELHYKINELIGLCNSLGSENKKLRELLNKNEDVILNIRDMLYDNEGGEYTYERDIIRAKLDREYNYMNGDDVVDFYQRKKD